MKDTVTISVEEYIWLKGQTAAFVHVAPVLDQIDQFKEGDRLDFISDVKSKIKECKKKLDNIKEVFKDLM